MCLAAFKVASQEGLEGRSSPVKVEEAVLGYCQGKSRQWSIGLTGRWAYSPVPLTFSPSSYTGLPGATVTRGKDRHEVAASLGKRLAGITGLWTCWVHAALEFSIPTRYCKMQYNTQPCKAKKHMTASGGPAGGKRCRGARIATLQTRLTLSSRVALRCVVLPSTHVIGQQLVQS